MTTPAVEWWVSLIQAFVIINLVMVTFAYLTLNRCEKQWSFIKTTREWKACYSITFIFTDRTIM